MDTNSCFEKENIHDNKPSESYFHRKKIIVTLTGGGFLWEAKALINGLGENYNFHFVTTHDSKNKVWNSLPKEKIHLISKITTMTDKTLWKKIKNAIISFRDSYKVIRNVDPVAVICIGSSIAVPLCFWAKILRKKAVFVESITRVSKPSLTGKMLSSFKLCDRLYVQWPEAEKLYKGAVYRGTVL